MNRANSYVDSELSLLNMANSHRRIERLDDFFLFITSVLGLSFSLLYTLFGYREIIYGFLPLLIIGVVIPIYIGYVRGAILLDTLEERVRGWIYFLYGVVFYLALCVLFTTNRLLTILNVEFEAFSALLSFVGYFALGFFLGRRRLYRWFCKNIFKAFNVKMTNLMYKIYDDTSSNAGWTSILLYVSFVLSLSENIDIALIFMMILLMSLGVVQFVFSERLVRKWVSLIRFSDFIEVESERTISYVSPRVVRIMWWVSIIDFFVLSLSLSFKWLPPTANLGLTIILLFGFILHTVSTEIEYIPVRKKDIPQDIEVELTKLLDRITKKKEESEKQENG